MCTVLEGSAQARIRAVVGRLDKLLGFGADSERVQQSDSGGGLLGGHLVARKEDAAEAVGIRASPTEGEDGRKGLLTSLEVSIG